jgi:carbonic anhydrase
MTHVIRTPSWWHEATRAVKRRLEMLEMCRSSLNLTNPEKALQEILDGNQRYVAGKLTHPRQTAQRRRELVPHQEPFATVLGCSDSRVPPEVIFDQGLGDLFVLRVAGNILDDEAVLGSLE